MPGIAGLRPARKIGGFDPHVSARSALERPPPFAEKLEPAAEVQGWVRRSGWPKTAPEQAPAAAPPRARSLHASQSGHPGTAGAAPRALSAGTPKPTLALTGIR